MTSSLAMRALGCLLIAGALLSGAEKRIARRDLPPAVQKAVEQTSQGARIAGYAKETEQGKTFYEVELKVDGRTRDVTFDENGNTISVEEEVAMAALPAAVQEGLRKAAGKGRITMVETINKGGVITYEAHVKGGARAEVVVDTMGGAVGDR